MGLEKRVLDELEREQGIVDVYFSNGKLYVLNGYDLKSVTAFMLVNYPDVAIVMDDEFYDAYGQV